MPLMAGGGPVAGAADLHLPPRSSLSDDHDDLARGGDVGNITVDRGDVVKEGQVLATLDTSVERATGAVAHAHAR